MGVYIFLFHGRTDPNQDLEDWGSEGPVFGPLDYAHTTYAGDIKFHFEDGINDGNLRWNGPDGDLIYYDGVWYGDVSVFSAEVMKLSPAEQARLVKFEQEKAIPPATEDIRVLKAGKHTPEPWNTDLEVKMEEMRFSGPYVDITAKSHLGAGLPVIVAGRTPEETQANARRVVVAINILKGIPTETLEEYLQEKGPITNLEM